MCLHNAPTHRYSRANLRRDHERRSCGRLPARPEPAAIPVPRSPLLCVPRVSYVLGGRFVRWPIRIEGSPASTAAWSSSSRRVSRSSMRSAVSRSHPSGVPRVARLASHSARRRGGPAQVQARTGGTGSRRAATADTPNGAPGRCTRPCAPSVDGPPRCRSSRPALGRSIAATASKASAEGSPPSAGSGRPRRWAALVAGLRSIVDDPGTCPPIDR
jgi:hypothetical protein